MTFRISRGAPTGTACTGKHDQQCARRGIEEGAPADLVAHRDDPLEDTGVLVNPTLVFLDGLLIADRR
jgi:hypothetical protein